MRITVIADPHLADDPAETQGVDTKANFARAVRRVRELGPDHVVLLGDYSARAPRRRDVAWACSRMRLADVPFSAVAGNHDDARHVAEVCGSDAMLVGERAYYRRDFGATRALFLDTSRGYLERDQLDWLALNVEGARDTTLVFMHHPPIEMGVPFMDRAHALRDDGGAVANILFGGSTPVLVFSGHYHTARTTQVGVHAVHLCPSTYYQLDPAREEFAVSHAMPGLRHVELLPGQVRTHVEFLRA